MPYLRHLSTSADLITAPEEIRAGFVALALERSRQASPFVEQARALKVSAMQAKHPNDLLEIEGIRTALLTAAGFSEKATHHTDETNKTAAIQGFIEKFLEPAGTNIVKPVCILKVTTNVLQIPSDPPLCSTRNTKNASFNSCRTIQLWFWQQCLMQKHGFSR